jgi:uncharacterized phage protein gp47/JayE
MSDLPTRLDLFAIGADYINQRATKIDPSQVYVLGSDINIIVGSQSVVNDSVVKQLAYAIARLYLDGAQGDDLDRLVFDRYGLTRKGASAALGAALLARPTDALGAGTVPVGTLLTTRTGVQYITTTAGTFGASALGPVSVGVRAVQAGKISQVGTYAINGFGSPSTLFDPTLTVSNPLATAGGEDAEDDDTLRSRVRNFWNTARRGVLAAIEQGALTVPGVVSAQAIEALTGGALPARVVNLYISDSSGVASVQLGAQVLAALFDYRAAGISVILSTSIPLIVNIQLNLSFQAGIDTDALSTLVQAAIMSYVNSLPVNGTLLLSALYTVLQRFTSDGLIVTQGSIAAPAGDLVPPIGQTLRTTLANITF